MSIKYSDRIKETCTLSGNDAQLTGAFDGGFKAFSTLLANNEYTLCCIVEDTVAYKIMLAQYNSVANQLVQVGTPLETHGVFGGGNKVVFCADAAYLAKGVAINRNSSGVPKWNYIQPQANSDFSLCIGEGSSVDAAASWSACYGNWSTVTGVNNMCFANVGWTGGIGAVLMGSGSDCWTNGDGSIRLGYEGGCDGEGATSIGYLSKANGDYSLALQGGVLTSAIPGAACIGRGVKNAQVGVTGYTWHENLGVPNEAPYSVAGRTFFKGNTTNNTPKYLKVGGNASSVDGIHYQVNNGQLLVGRFQVLGYQYTGGTYAWQQTHDVVVRGGTMVSKVSSTAIVEGGISAASDIVINVGLLKVQVTGVAANNMEWVCRAEYFTLAN